MITCKIQCYCTIIHTHTHTYIHVVKQCQQHFFMYYHCNNNQIKILKYSKLIPVSKSIGHYNLVFTRPYITYTSFYIRCAHSGTSTLALCARQRRCASLHLQHKEKNNCPCRESNLHAEPPSDLKSIALSTWSWGKLYELFKASPFFSAKYDLRAAWDNGVSQ